MKNKLKSWIINLATGKIVPQIIASVGLAVATQLMVLWQRSESILPDLNTVLNPADVADLITKIITYMILFAVSKMTGKPIREWQIRAKDADEYDGEIDGYAGPKFDAALREMINNHDITVPVKKPQLVPGKVSASGKF